MNSFAYIDHLLRNREQVTADIQDESRVAANTSASLWVFLCLSAFYGLIMGSQNLVHGGPDGWKYTLAAAVKLPILFLLTLAICMPLLYVLNVLIGPRARFRTILALLLASIAVTSVVLASCALIVLFFMLSTKSYEFIKMLNVIVFAIAGGYGVWFLRKGMQALAPAVPKDSELGVGGGVRVIMNWWLITYAVVGTQMAWLLRPFVGSPQAFSFLRAQDSNFYVNLIHTIETLGR
jgi:hypothetical protein